MQHVLSAVYVAASNNRVDMARALAVASKKKALFCPKTPKARLWWRVKNFVVFLHTGEIE